MPYPSLSRLVSGAGFVTPRQTFVPRYHGGNCRHRAVEERDRCEIMTRSPYERPLTRSVSALLTGSSRQPLNRFIGVPHSHVELDAGPLSDARFVIPRQTFVPRCYGGNFPWRAVKDAERGPLRPSILTGTSLHPVDARALPPGYPTPQTCRRPMVLQRKSNAAPVNLDRSSGDERAIADT